jgi:hypothetical protein
MLPLSGFNADKRSNFKATSKYKYSYLHPSSLTSQPKTGELTSICKPSVQFLKVITDTRVNFKTDFIETK